jgi:hypothetical protein
MLFGAMAIASYYLPGLVVLADFDGDRNRRAGPHDPARLHPLILAGAGTVALVDDQR